jgi:glycosyltransferase involved in cell wall biosynthesis
MEKIHHLTIITKLELGGAQQVALYTLEHLPPAKYARYLIAGEGGLLDAAARAIPQAEVHLWKSLKHPIRPLHDLWTCWRLAQFMRQHKIQIVHTHSSKAGLLGRLAARWAGVPLVFHTVHGWPFHEYQQPWLRKLYVVLERLAARWTTGLIAVSQATREKGLQHGIGRAEQYTVIFPGSDLSAFKPGTLAERKTIRAELGLPVQAPVVGMVACFKPQKAPLDFIQAAGLLHQTLPEVKFVLVGDGPLRNRIEAEIAARGLRETVILLGWRNDIARIMRALDVFSLSSLWEGLPCVFAQALASGLPVVATRVEGAPEIIQENKTGCLVAPGKPGEMAERLKTLLQNPGLMKRMGALGPKGARHFMFPVMQKSILKLYQKYYENHLKSDGNSIKTA